MATEEDIKQLSVAESANPDSAPIQSTSTSTAQSSPKDESSSIEAAGNNIPVQSSLLSSLAALAMSQQPTQEVAFEKRVLESLQDFLPLIIGIAIFGASTFASLVSQLAEPASQFSLSTVRNFMAIAWVLFIAALGVAMFGIAVIKPESTRPCHKGHSRMLVEVARLVIVAFLFLSLVVVAYAGPVGWVAVGFTACGISFTIGLWVQWGLNPGTSDVIFCD